MTEFDSTLRRTAAFALLGLGLVTVYATVALGEGDPERPMQSLTAILLAFILYLLALAACRPLSGPTAFAVALLGGLIFRLLLLPEPPYLSDDVFRYLWDGEVQLFGVNPYRHAPSDPAVAGIDDALRSQVNHPRVPTIYPPLAQIAFLAAAALPGGWLPLKLLWLLCDMLIAVLLWRLVPRDWRLGAWTIYWWSPLVVVEVAWNAHLDLLGVLPLVLAVWLARHAPQRHALIGAALGGAALVKYFAAGLLAAAARCGRPARVVAGFVALVMLLYLPYLSVGPRMFDGLATYASAWRFNDGAFRALAWITTQSIAKVVVAIVVLWIVVGSVRNRWSLERAAFWVTGAILVLSPTLHPWYLLWMVPLVAIRPGAAWLYLSGSVFLAYYGLGSYQATGTWPEPGWLALAIHGPFWILLAAEAWPGSWLQMAMRELTAGPVDRR